MSIFARKISTLKNLLRLANFSSKTLIRKLIWKLSGSQNFSFVYFDEEWYRSQNPDVVKSNVPGLYHYFRRGYKLNKSPHPLFDEEWYRSQNPDVVKSNVPGLYHYLRFGFKEDRSPNDWIDINLLKAMEN